MSSPSPAKPEDGPSIGLALSGGGFRATLFHLGVIRALRDQGLLTRVNAISGVSGGSILAAHLALQWHRYTSPYREDFDEAVDELLAFVRMGPRGRILHRLPWIGLYGVIRSLVPFLPGQHLNHSDLLQHYLAKLYRHQDLGSLADTPENKALRPGTMVGGTSRPDVYLLATNLTTGGLCAFTDEGMMPSVTVGALSSIESQVAPSTGRGKGGDDDPAGRMPDEVIGIKTGMIPISMAVAASAAIPHFFPPVVVAVKPLGVDRSGVKADPQYMTDGGVIDNTGAVAFRTLYRKEPDRNLWKPVPILRPDGEVSRTHKDRQDLNMILVSRAGGPLDFQGSSRIGTISTATRSVDILMDRISRLAVDDNDPSLITIDIQTEVEDNPELIADVQRTLKRVRTDLDRFSAVEINALLKHGYEVGRTRIAQELREHWSATDDPARRPFCGTPPTDTDYRAWRTLSWHESNSIPERVLMALGWLLSRTFLLLSLLVLMVWRLVPLQLLWSGGRWLARSVRDGLATPPATGAEAEDEEDPESTLLAKTESEEHPPPDPCAAPPADAAGQPLAPPPPSTHGTWIAIKAWARASWDAELSLTDRQSVGHLRGPHEERLRTRVLMRSSRRRIFSGSSSDWLAPVNLLILVTVLGLGAWNLWTYLTRPGFEIGFDDFPGEQWAMEFQYDDYPDLFLASLKRVQRDDLKEQDKILDSVFLIKSLLSPDVVRAQAEQAEDAEQPREGDRDSAYSEYLRSRRGDEDAVGHPLYDTFLKLLLKQENARLRSATLEPGLPPYPPHTALSSLKACRDRGEHYPSILGDRWFGRGRIIMPQDEQFDYTFEIEFEGDVAIADFHIPSLFQRNNPRTYKALLIRSEAQPCGDDRIQLEARASTEDPSPTSTRARLERYFRQLGPLASANLGRSGGTYYIGELFRLTDLPPTGDTETAPTSGETTGATPAATPEDDQRVELDGQVWEKMKTRVLFQRIERVK